MFRCLSCWSATHVWAAGGDWLGWACVQCGGQMFAGVLVRWGCRCRVGFAGWEEKTKNSGSRSTGGLDIKYLDSGTRQDQLGKSDQVQGVHDPGGMACPWQHRTVEFASTGRV
ncbi:hypothetical protein EDC01DRAFT_91891 [Geopyxis carbonaria]|nr:hypothetical protein EDC01DRAFT_91891 [Geopyxis carbonaria]